MTNYPKIYYVSQGQTPQEHLNNIDKVCRAGIKFVQLRLKDEPIETIKQVAIEAQSICLKYKTQLFINDYVDIMEHLPTAGLHIGKNDQPIEAARANFPNTIIGGTANTLADCIHLAKNGADYIGLGPFKFTETKANLDPILGLSGYKDIISKLATLKITTPIYAIGGITEQDIQTILNIGLAGVAVSGLLTHKTELEIKAIINLYE